MDKSELTRHRLHNQQIADQQFDQVADLVRWMGGLQAQDYPSAKWALGLRMPNAGDDEIEQAVAAKKILRTWSMRGTLFCVPSEDAGWMVSLFAERSAKSAAGRHRQLKLEKEDFKRSQDLFANALTGGNLLIRSELYALLEGAGIQTDTQRGYHLLWMAGLAGLICIGPLRDKQPTYALLDEMVPKPRQVSHEEGLAMLASRYFRSHGPATLEDFVWWLGTSKTEGTRAFESAKDKFVEEEVDGVNFWMSSESTEAQAASPEVHLLPGFDEYLIGYTHRENILGSKYSGDISPYRNGIIQPTILLDGQTVGTWGRKTKKKSVEVTPKFFERPNKSTLEAFETGAGRYANYLGLELEIK